MGNWNITIQGTGPHHNIERPYDADKLARAFLEQFVRAGHQIEHASFTAGGRDDLLSQGLGNA